MVARGKDPLASVMSIVELVGPSQFSHWDESGQPVGKPHPTAHVQVTAVSMEQTTNTTDLYQSLIPERTRREFNMEVQKEVIYANGGKQKLKALAASFRSAEGARLTFAILGETHHWTASTGGHKFYRTLSNNMTKVGGRFICITNAYEPGEESVAQTIREEQEKVWLGLTKASGWLYDSLEAHPEAPLTDDWAPYVVRTIRGDAIWLDAEIIVEAMQDGSVPASTKRRMWYNQIVASEDALYSPGEWDGALRPGCYGDKRDLSPGDEVVLGFDGSKTDDATALVAIRISDHLIVPLAIWQNPDPSREWRVNELDVDSEVHAAFATYKVRAFYADTNLWESYINSWSEQYRERLLIKATAQSTIGFDMRGNKAKVARTNETLLGSIVDRKIEHNGNKLLRNHALNCYRRHNGFGLTFGKETEESPRKVDGYAATMLAFMALTDLAESGKKAKPEYTRRLIQM